MKKHILIIILFCLTAVYSAYGQRGKEFWFAVPKITTGDGGANEKVRFVFTSYDQVVNINIEQVAVPGFTPINIQHTLQPNTSWEWNAGATYLGQLEIMANYPQPYALHMTGNADFSVYYANVTRNSEVYTLKGENALGTYFIVPMQYEYISGSYADGFNSIQILATEDSTRVEVELFKRTNHPQQTADHQTITFYLDKGFAYAFHSLLEDNCPGIDHLYNTRIRSNKPIAVNSTDDSVQPGDLLGDQIVPVSLWGQSYIAIKNDGNIEKVYIFPSEDNTVVTINGVAQPVMNLNGNNKMVVSLSSTATYIESNKKIMVWQIATVGNEIGGGMLPKLECTGSMEASYRRAGENLIFNIVTRSDQTDAFTVNGTAGIIIPSDFVPVPGHPEYSYCRKNMNPYSTANGVRLKNSEGYFHVAAFDTPGSSCTYGYFSDYHDIRLNVVSALPNYTPGDVIHLYMTNADAFTDIQWTKPDGTIVNADEILIPNPTAADAGFYVVTATSKDGCTIEEDGVVVVNFVLPSSSNTSICEGESVELSAAGYAPYAWLPTSETTQTINPSPANTTVYRVNNRKIAENIVYNGNFQKGNTMFTSDYAYGGTSATAVSTTGKYSVWRNAKEVNSPYTRIYDHTNHSSTDGRFLIVNCSNKPKEKIWTRKVDVIPNAQYEFAAWFVAALRGGSKAKLRFSVNSQPVGNVIEMTDPNTTPNIASWKQSSATWQNTTGVTAEISIEVAEDSPDGAGVCIDDITFRPLLAITDTFTVNVVPKPHPVITGDTVLCQGVATLNAGGNYDTYKWYKLGNQTVLSTSKVYNPTSSGQYTVVATNGICSASDTFEVAAPAEFTVILTENDFSICPDETNISLQYQSTGNAVYDLIFDNAASQAGFADILNQPSNGNDSITVPLPANLPAGDYHAKLKFTDNGVCSESPEISVKITVKLDPNLFMAQKWNNVLALYNENYNPGRYTYTAMQWYKNGEPMTGETHSYIYLGEGNTFAIGDRYAVLLTLNDSTQIMTCDFTPEQRTDVFPFPTVVNPLQTIKLQDITGAGTATF
ncbi:MAG: IgGFc-binding protein, partial [Paludibacter sp.]|nr:IgGFc-binding protein [Paludibacter sp.]